MKTLSLIVALIFATQVYANPSAKISNSGENTVSVKQYSLELKNGKRLNLVDVKRKNIKLVVELKTIEIGKEVSTTNGGGWQPENTKFQSLENEIKEFLRVSAQENCSGKAIAESLQNTFGDNLEDQTVDISSLPVDVKMCLEK